MIECSYEHYGTSMYDNTFWFKTNCGFIIELRYGHKLCPYCAKKINYPEERKDESGN